MTDKMDYAIGIDLGSTTTKAVVLDQERQVLGRGITNSRSNYDVACQVSLGEALINARFSLIANELARDGMAAPDVEALLEHSKRLVVVPPRFVDLADVVQGGAFALFVADLPHDVEALLEHFKRLVVVRPRAVDLADVAPRCAVAMT